MKKVVLLAALLAVPACATKTYPIAMPLSDQRAMAMSCQELAFEMADIVETEVAIKDEADFDLRSAGAILADFGIGNSNVRRKADKALAERKAAVARAQSGKQCTSVSAAR